jgi:hypothetical protein
MTDSEEILSLAMRRRTEKGLRLEWFIPADDRNFVAYAKDEAQKQAWLAKAKANGWRLVQP